MVGQSHLSSAIKPKHNRNRIGGTSRRITASSERRSDKLWQHVAALASDRPMCSVTVWRLIGVDLQNPSAILQCQINQARCRMHDAAGANRHEQPACTSGPLGLKQCLTRKFLAEPDDSRSLSAAAGTSRRIAHRSRATFFAFHCRSLRIAIPTSSVQLDHVRRTGSLVQTIHILGDQRESFPLGDEMLLKFGKCEVTCIRDAFGDVASASSYQRVTSSGSRANASGVARSAGSNFDHKPVSASRNVGTPLSAETPAPVNTAMWSAERMHSSN